MPYICSWGAAVAGALMLSFSPVMAQTSLPANPAAAGTPSHMDKVMEHGKKSYESGSGAYAPTIMQQK